ncbi:MAG: hypothetical protein RIT45_2918 [Pseudomonadota bacterium]
MSRQAPVFVTRPAPADDPIVCCCNGVPLSEIVRAMDEGAVTLSDLFDRTWAGCGPCGGSCQPDLEALLADYAERDREAG